MGLTKEARPGKSEESVPVFFGIDLACQLSDRLLRETSQGQEPHFQIKSEGNIMKGFLITVALIAAIAVGGYAMGWLSFADTDSKSSVEVNKDKVEADTEKAKEVTKEAANKVVEETKEAVESLEGESEEAAKQGKESLKEGAEDLEDTSEKLQENLEENPNK
jgi:hypothetical protein